MEWGRQLATLSADTLCAGVTKYMEIKFEFSEICPKIVGRIRDNGGSMSRREILRAFQRHVKRGVDIEAAMTHLVNAEQVERKEIKSEKGGRSSVVYSLLE